MTVLNAVQAGRYLGVAERTVRNMINRGELSVLSTDPIRLDSAHVDDVLRARQADALADLARRMQDPVALARETLRVLRPQRPGTNLPQDRAEEERRRLSLVSDTARLLFGQASLTAALLADDSCRWCRSADFAKVLNTWAPTVYSEGFAALLGGPCERCAPGLYRPLMEAMRARVRGGAVRPSEAAPRPSAAERQAAYEWASQRPATAAVKRVGDDGGKALVARRRREVQAQLTAAKRRGDQRYAIQLQQTLRSLTADAAAVDGRTTASRPGTLRCGHALAANCSCPRLASRRSTS